MAARWIADADADAAPFLLMVGEGTAFWLALADRLAAEPELPWREAGRAAFVCPDAARDPLANARIGEILAEEARWETLIAVLTVGDPHRLLPDALAQYLALPSVDRATALLAVSSIARADRAALRPLARKLARHGLTAAAASAASAAVADDLE